jgi:hypothetical protein
MTATGRLPPAEKCPGSAVLTHLVTTTAEQANRRLSCAPMSGSPVPLRPDLRDKIAEWPEFRMGVHRIAVLLRDGTTVHEVFVSGGLIRGVGSTQHDTGPIPFGPDDIADVQDESGW